LHEYTKAASIVIVKINLSFFISYIFSYYSSSVSTSEASSSFKKE